jgi:predicted O-linked N-acetylglucosamine transferase (SPINDLY family)
VNFDPALGIALTELINLISQGDLGEARQRAGELLVRYPNQAELWRLSAICALQQGDFAPAQRSLDRALELAPNSVEAWCNLASLHTARGQLDAAERALRRALVLTPNHAAALNNLGSLLDARGDYYGAAESFAKAISLRPDYARAWLNQAAALLAVRQLERAESSARRAIALAPQWADAHFVLGNILVEGGRTESAAAAYRAAVTHAPNDVRFHYQLALTLDDRSDYAGAIAAYEQALRRQPDFWPALSQLVYLKRRVCDWNGLAPLTKRLLAAVDNGESGLTPFSLLVEDSTPAQQLACARRFSELKQAQTAPLQERLAPGPRARATGPIRIGFVSAGFGEHPTALLIAELIERLQNSHLRSIGFATTRDDGGPLRARLKQSFHEFNDLSGMALESMVQRLREARIDVLIDLDGYCDGSRPELFAFRTSPIQVNWLAYPGTLGAPWYDYLIADRYVIPSEQRVHYSEKLALLPRCYQPTDTTRVVESTGPRTEHGLPEKGFVFASFNNSWKFTLRSFARWMKILKSVPGSVLWLLTGPEKSLADTHLRRAAHAAGVDPQRLIFAPRVNHGEHLARYRHADLFLDTNPYNAHTTASDAIWAGCPVLTQPGQTFASRVAGSLNHHLGLHQLIAESDQAYVEIAVKLAMDATSPRRLHDRVNTARRESGSFDMAGYARDFETALTTMFTRFAAGYDPQDFEVTSQ